MPRQRSPRRSEQRDLVLTILAFVMLTTALLVRVATAAAPVELRRWFVVPQIDLRIEQPAPPRRADPYAGWSRWCEPIEPAACKRDRDCARAPDGKRQRCVVPWWAPKRMPKGERPRVCASPWPGRSEQKWREQRLRAVVEHVCTKGCDAAELGTFLSIVAGRESTWRPWKAHRLNADLRANRVAWQRMAPRYADNPHHRQQHRWQGLGLFGQNAALFAFLWDPKAPPEVLCREPEAIDTYLARARIAANKQTDLGIRPTWATIHAALAQGEVRPSPAALERFRRQAAKVGLDADHRVTSRDLGRRLGADVPSRRLGAELLRAQIDARFGAVLRPAV